MEMAIGCVYGSYPLSDNTPLEIEQLEPFCKAKQQAEARFDYFSDDPILSQIAQESVTQMQTHGCMGFTPDYQKLLETLAKEKIVLPKTIQTSQGYKASTKSAFCLRQTAI
jgi:hypothetical protein